MLKQNLAVSIPVKAHESLRFIISGAFYSGKWCESRSVDHAATIVGYSHKNGGYWLIKDSRMKSLNLNRAYDENLVIKVKWRENFFPNKENEKKCFCGGEGKFCHATAYSREQIKMPF